jgi:hypothetical protein
MLPLTTSFASGGNRQSRRRLRKGAQLVDGTSSDDVGDFGLRVKAVGYRRLDLIQRVASTTRSSPTRITIWRGS